MLRHLGPFYLFLVSLASHIAREGATPWAFPLVAPPIPVAVFFDVFGALSCVHLGYVVRPRRGALPPPRV